MVILIRRGERLIMKLLAEFRVDDAAHRL